MNFALVAATFAIIVPAELPDKTFISTIVLSTRYRALPVWIGVACGLVTQAAIAVAAGRLLELLPHRAVTAVTAALFFLGAAYLLFASERSTVTKGEEVAEGSTDESEHELPALRIVATAFTIVALTEFGDLTQIIIANLTARSREPWSVFTGAALAFIAISAAGVATGRGLTRVVPLSVIRRISGLALLALGVWSTVSAAT